MRAGRSGTVSPRRRGSTGARPAARPQTRTPAAPADRFRRRRSRRFPGPRTTASGRAAASRANPLRRPPRHAACRPRRPSRRARSAAAPPRTAPCHGCRRPAPAGSLRSRGPARSTPRRPASRNIAARCSPRNSRACRAARRLPKSRTCAARTPCPRGIPGNSCRPCRPSSDRPGRGRCACRPSHRGGSRRTDGPVRVLAHRPAGRPLLPELPRAIRPASGGRLGKRPRGRSRRRQSSAPGEIWRAASSTAAVCLQL